MPSQLLLLIDERKRMNVREMKKRLIALVYEGSLIVRLFPMFLYFALGRICSCLSCMREKKSSGDATMNDVSKSSRLIVYNYAVNIHNASSSHR